MDMLLYFSNLNYSVMPMKSPVRLSVWNETLSIRVLACNQWHTQSGTVGNLLKMLLIEVGPGPGNHRRMAKHAGPRKSLCLNAQAAGAAYQILGRTGRGIPL